MSLFLPPPDSQNPNKKQRRNLSSDSEDEMSLFFKPPTSNQFLNVPPAPFRKQALPQRDDVDDFLSSDLELSFASTVSLNSPPRDHANLAPEYEPMDISPAPPSKNIFEDDNTARLDTKPFSRPRAFTSGARMFGRDMSNNVSPSPQQPQRSDAKRTQRGALPSEWLMAVRSTETNVNHSENIFAAAPSPVSEDAMDVDSDVPDNSIPLPRTAALDTLFYNTMSPRRSLDSPSGPQCRKRRSFSPEPTRPMDEAVSSPSPLSSSPSQRKVERISLGNGQARFNKPTLQGLGSPTSNLPKRPRKLVLSACVQPSYDVSPLQSASTYPILTGGSSAKEDSKKAPTRRAFSALIPPKGFSSNEPYSDESSFDGPDMSSPAQAYAKRQQVKTIRRCDGADDLKPLTAIPIRDMQESPSSKFMAAGLPGFGDNEAHGKILPCHRVTEDGLMRINCKTLDDLLDGVFASQISEFHVIDCRFDYEYIGGHIPGAVNIRTPSAVEEFLLGPKMAKPRPCLSGDAFQKTVLVFHCEFSAKRAPTFAKHLRAKDRAINNHVYPKIHYPEVYILEGGYCQYFKNSATRCQPSGYISMDDPNHVASRNEDMDLFRKTKFGRYKSYAYGEGPFKANASSSQQQPKRNTAPNAGSNPLFAAANAARTRRGGGLSVLAEDGNSTAHSDEDTDIGDSPCPPPTKTTAFKGKKIGRPPLARAETYGPARMAH